jgi:acyl-coenzyme A thioesterase PaaI-like protein
LFTSQVKLAGTARLRILAMSESEATVRLANKKRVQNHIGGIHAVGAALAAESASGIVFGMNVPDSHLPLLKSMTLEYNKRMQGAICAKATLSDEQKTLINSQEKGDILVPVTLTDESGETPIECQMNWAWVPKRRR